ncbi:MULTISPECIES: DUF6660 family protein [Bacteroidota]|jgi:hypothetical protein
MKYLSLIFATFTLMLSTVPIEGACRSNSYDGVYNYSNTESSQQESGNQDNENCPPLCGCQCSHVHAISFGNNRVIINLVFADNNKLPRNYNNGISFNLINAIWHPPKFSE